MENHLCVYKDGDTILAIVVKSGFSKKGVEFFTPPDFSQQLGYMSHEKGKSIRAHMHNLVKREVRYTQEILFIRKGRMRVSLYSSGSRFVNSFVLEAGDVILLASGGHGFEVLEEIEMFEVKQGPYAGNSDKSYIEEVSVDPGQ